MTKEQLVTKAVAQGWYKPAVEDLIATVMKEFEPKNYGYAFAYWGFITKRQAENFVLESAGN